MALIPSFALMLRKAIVHARVRAVSARRPREEEEKKAVAVLDPCKHCGKELPINDFPCALCEGRVCTAAGDCNKLFPRDPNAPPTANNRRPFSGKPWLCARPSCGRRILCPGVEEFDESVRSCLASGNCPEMYCGACVEHASTCIKCGLFACIDCSSVPFLLNGECDRCAERAMLLRVDEQFVRARALANQ